MPYKDPEKAKIHSRAYARKSYWRNPEKHRKSALDYHKRNKEKVRAQHKIYRQTHRDELKARFVALKQEVMSHYCKGSPKCACCGESEFVFLTLDHIVGRKAIGHGKEFSGHKLRVWLKKSGYPEGFQVLCLNCNAAKSDKGVCPHQKKPTKP